jgi:hypothetical protein
VPDGLIQRHFYWSAASFHRCYYLFLSYLVLDKKGLSSWAHVTGYYSRFYFVQALSNLWLSHIVRLNPKKIHDKRDGLFLTRIGRDGVRLKRLQAITDMPRGSHQRWWRLLRELHQISDIPAVDDFAFVTGEAYFSSQTRNQTNYSARYLEGFVELEWFDTDLESMLSHLRSGAVRSDRDITDFGRFFEDSDPEYAGEADFYGDEAQILWTSITSYLKILEALDFPQPLISTEKLRALNEVYLVADYPKMTEGIDRFLSGIHLVAER